MSNLQARLQSFKFKYLFPTKKSEISADIDNFRKGCREIIESKNLHKILEVCHVVLCHVVSFRVALCCVVLCFVLLFTLVQLILLVGNFVNGGTNRGNANGFKLSSLTKVILYFSSLLYYPLTYDTRSRTPSQLITNQHS